MKFLRVAALLLPLSFAAAVPVQAARPAPVNLAPAEGEVIVRFKAEADTLRRHALSARGGTVAAQAVLEQRAATLGGRIGRTLQAGPAIGERMQVVRAGSIGAAALAAQLAADPDVEFAEPNGRKRRLTPPNDPYYLTGPPLNTAAGTGGPVAGQWYLRAPAASVSLGPVSSINVEAAWNRTVGSSNVVVAVLDTGVRREHPDLNGRLLQGRDFVSNATVANDGNGRDDDPSDPGDWVSASEANSGVFVGCAAEASSWHGTSTASLVGASTNDGVGMAGTAPGVRVLPVRVLGKCFGYDSDIQAAMLWAAGIAVPGEPDNPNPAQVINMSLGGSGSCSASYQSVVNQILAKGVVIVAAAGNSAGGPVGTPGNCTGVISVLALRHAGTKVGFSDLGTQITIAAPGGNCVNLTGACLYPILAATNSGTQGPVASTWTDSYDASVGTSFASPLVAGTVGLMFSAQPALTPDLVRSRIRATARPFPTTGGDTGAVTACHAPSSTIEQLECYCNTTYCGAGMLDAGAAVQSAASPVAQISVSTAAPTAGSPVTLSAAGSLPAVGAPITGYAWTITSGGGIVSAFTSATNAATATLTPSAAGSFTVRVDVSDSLGNSAFATQNVTVAAAPVVGPPDSGGSGGGGALGLPALLGLLAAAALLRVSRRRA